MRFVIVCALMAMLGMVRGEYPANFPKCKNADEPCLVKATNEILQNYYTGSPEINIVPLDPLHVKSLTLKRNPSSPVDVEVKLNDLELSGMKSFKVSSFKGLNADIKGRSSFEGKISDLALRGHYSMDGRAIVIPIRGDGNMELVFKNVDLKFSFDLKPVEKDGKIYAALEHVKCEMEPEHLRMYFANLFGGDQALSDTTNEFVNANWKEIYQELKPGILKGIGLVLKSVINNFFKNQPYSDFFL